MEKKILVLCTGNSCRSQIAEGYLKAFVPDGTKVFSAGVETHGVNSKAIETMKKDGIDIGGQTSNNVNEFMDIEFNYMITVCDNAKERCPHFSSKAYRFHKNFPDPAKAKGAEFEVVEKFDEVRDMIKQYCKQFVDAYL
jgi:arsenate reductase